MTQTTKKTYSFISLNMISIEINFNIDDVNWGQKFVEGSFLLCLNLIQSWKNENNLFTSLHITHFTKLKIRHSTEMNENNSAVSVKLDQQTYRNTESLFSKQI